MERVCQNCRFYDFSDGVGNEEVGECRRKPPTWDGGARGDYGWGRDDVIRWLFPLVRGDDWCGKWKALEQNATQAIHKEN